MKHLTNRLLTIIGGAMLIALLSGCQTPVGLGYTPQKDVAPVSGADRVTVNLSVIDTRLIKYIGTDEGDGDVSYIFATNDIAAVLKNSIADELVHRGFKLSDSGVNLLVGLNTIDVNALGKGFAISVQIVRPDGTIGYSQFITGKGHTNPFLSFFSIDVGKTFKLRLDRALQICLSQLFADPSFINALLKAQGGLENVGRRVGSS